MGGRERPDVPPSHWLGPETAILMWIAASLWHVLPVCLLWPSSCAKFSFSWCFLGSNFPTFRIGQGHHADATIRVGLAGILMAHVIISNMLLGEGGSETKSKYSLFTLLNQSRGSLDTIYCCLSLAGKSFSCFVWHTPNNGYWSSSLVLEASISLICLY